MSLDKLHDALEHAATAVAADVQQISAASMTVIEGALRAKKKAVMRIGIGDLGAALVATQKRGVYQDFSPSLDYPASLMDGAAADMAQQLANAAAANITGALS